jgi:REP element-mobilizing transposase RayT
MTRAARIDIPGILHHVIVRGIEKCPIFLDDEDRLSFATRLSTLLGETRTDCLAWAFLDNHLHILLRPQQIKLATFMRRLLTGYAVTFNLRHKRSGHLFQNRYKSIVCEDELYLLELVRYIHLNPLRAGIVKSMDELDFYPWCGHAVVLGNKVLSGQNTVEVLTRFGKRINKARPAYRQFVAEGISQGRRNELVGGGMKRSQANVNPAGRVEAYDARVLGSGDFVESLLLEAEGKKPAIPITLADLATHVALMFELSPDLLAQRIRTKNVSTARSVLCYIAVREIGYSGVELAEFLGQSRAGICLSAARGEVMLMKYPMLKKNIDSYLTT